MEITSVKMFSPLDEEESILGACAFESDLLSTLHLRHCVTRQTKYRHALRVESQGLLEVVDVSYTVVFPGWYTGSKRLGENAF